MFASLLLTVASGVVGFVLVSTDDDDDVTRSSILGFLAAGSNDAFPSALLSVRMGAADGILAGVDMMM